MDADIRSILTRVAGKVEAILALLVVQSIILAYVLYKLGL